MKIYCRICDDLHYDKDGVPDCDFFIQFGFPDLEPADKEKLWNHMLSPLLDELTVRYNSCVYSSLRAVPADVYITPGDRIYFPQISSTTWLHKILSWAIRKIIWLFIKTGGTRE